MDPRLPLPRDVVFPGETAQVAPEFLFPLCLVVAQKGLASVVHHICPKLLPLPLRSAMPLDLSARFAHKMKFMNLPNLLDTNP